MGKISPVSSKYIINANIEIEGVVDRPDVIGAVFGQTEGLLGADLELRELQRSGRIGRIEVNVDTKSGKTKGMIILPSSLDKAETSIVAASLEIIQRIGPCNARIKVEKIEDVRVSKRLFVIQRAKELLKTMMDTTMPDSQELSDEVAYSVRVMELQEYGKDRVPAGPGLDEAEEVIVVEGRADVLNLLKHGFKNVAAISGTNIPPTIIELTKKKEVTLFVDGDRGGDLIIKEMLSLADIDFIAKAPDGKEVEEITKKEIHQALRSKIAAEQYKLDYGIKPREGAEPREIRKDARGEPRQERSDRPEQRGERPVQRFEPRQVSKPVQQEYKKSKVSDEHKAKFKEILENLVGTRGACILNDKLEILGKVPVTELLATLKSLHSGIYAVIFDGSIDKDLVMNAEKSGVRHLVGMDSKVKPESARLNILTADDL